MSDDQTTFTFTVVPKSDLIWGAGNRWGRRVEAVDLSGNKTYLMNLVLDKVN